MRIANIQHLATAIRAQLAAPVSAVELAGLLHPTPAVGGEPAAVALPLIRALEGIDRGDIVEVSHRSGRRFYALVRLTYGEPVNPAKAAELEVDWWRVHREAQHSAGSTSDDLVEALIRLYCYLYDEPEDAIRPAAEHRARAMDLSDQWVKQGCLPDSPLLPLEHAALVRAYAALLAAVHH